MVRYTWSKQWPAEALIGVSSGVLGLTAFCLQRSMGAPTWTSPWLIVLGQALWILAPAWPPLLARMKRRHAFAWIGWVSRGPLLLVALASVTARPELGADHGMGDWWILFATYLLSNNLDALYVPHRGAFLRANYPLEVRGRIYGLATVVVGVASMGGALLAGSVLDHDPVVVRWIFPAAAVAGVAGHVLLSKIRWRYDGPQTVERTSGAAVVAVSLKNAARSTAKTIRGDRAFRDFEIGFMLYGLGLLSASPLIVSRFAQDAAFSTRIYATADRFVLPATQLLCVWLVGRLSDRIGVVRVAALAFGSLVPYFLGMMFVATPTHLYAINVLFGFCMAGVNVSWALGPLWFAPPGEAHHYSAVHVACVGVRSVVGPLLGWLVQSTVSFHAALMVSAGLEATGAVWMFLLARRVHVPS